MAGNYKSASLQLQNSGQLQNNSINSAMLITINRVKSKVNKHLLSLEHVRWDPKWTKTCLKSQTALKSRSVYMAISLWQRANDSF